MFANGSVLLVGAAKGAKVAHGGRRAKVATGIGGMSGNENGAIDCCATAGMGGE